MVIVLIGAEASGKMTIGQQLSSKLGFCFLFNHQVIDLVGEVFDKEHHGTMWQLKPHHGKLIWRIWMDILHTAMENNENLVFTCTLNYKDPDLEAQFMNLNQYADRCGTKILYVQLHTELNERLRRNKTENRLMNKVCKRDIAESEAYLLASNDFIQYESNGVFGAFNESNYLYLDNTNLDPTAAADCIIAKVLSIIGN